MHSQTPEPCCCQGEPPNPKARHCRCRQPKSIASGPALVKDALTLAPLCQDTFPLSQSSLPLRSPGTSWACATSPDSERVRWNNRIPFRGLT